MTDLVTLATALAPYQVTVRQARAWIAKGRLPAAKVGRAYLVDPNDVARLLAPTVRQSRPRGTRESEIARARRQLRAAGIDA